MEVTVEITDYCPNECDYCSTNADVHGLPLDISVIREFFEGLESKVDRINISGGEPLSHPSFYEILNLCKSYTDNVWVYTNALTKIMYNTDIIKEVEIEANVCLTPGRNVYIPENVGKVHLLQLVSQGRACDMKPANLHASGNISKSNCDCSECEHILLQADMKVVDAPCKKEY